MKKLTIIIALCCACEFRISDKAVREELDEAVSIQFASLLVGERTMHYAFTDQNKDVFFWFSCTDLRDHGMLLLISSKWTPLCQVLYPINR